MHITALATGAVLLGALTTTAGWSGSPAPTDSSVSSLPGARTYTVDNVHSTVMFKIKHSGVAWAYGRFNQVSGEIVLDDEAEDCSVLLEVEAKSVDTGSEGRDRHLRAPDFFDVVQHPLLGFESTSVGMQGDRYEVEGVLTLHGVTKDMTVLIEKVGEVETARGRKAGFFGEFTIDRRDFGMTTYSDTSSLGNDVTITVSIEAKEKSS